MTSGAFHLTVIAMSSSSRALGLWTIWLTANGGGVLRRAAIVGGERFGDFVQPLVKLRNGACVKRGKSADDPSLALGDYQRRMRDDEQRSADDRQPELAFQNFR